MGDIIKTYSDGLWALKLNNVAWIQAPLEKEQIFNDHGVDLLKEAGVFLMKTLMSRAQDFFNAEDFITIVEDSNNDEGASSYGEVP